MIGKIPSKDSNKKSFIPGWLSSMKNGIAYAKLGGAVILLLSVLMMIVGWIYKISSKQKK